MILAVDFDGVLSHAEWPAVGDFDVEIINALIAARAFGHKLVLWTCREGDDLTKAIVELDKLGIKFDLVNQNDPIRIDQYQWNSRKINADVYYDDKAFGWDRDSALAHIQSLSKLKEEPKAILQLIKERMGR